MHTFDLNIGDMSKIEGKISLDVRVRNGVIEDCQFKISEYKRFYTQAIRGKDIRGLPQLTSRICGTCSIAHLLCAIKAVEHAVGMEVTLQTEILRRLLYFGLIIRDHALHLYVFVLPDILGIDNILELDENNPDQHQILDDTFTVKEAGNLLSKAIGGRSVHAPYPVVGGFAKLPDEKSFLPVLQKLEEARPAVLRLIKILLDCNFHLEKEMGFVALMDDKYSFLEGNIITDDGLVLSQTNFGEYLDKAVVPYSQASGYKFMGKIHLVGALARLNLAKDRLHEKTKKDAYDALQLFPSQNIFHNNLAQAIETLHSIDSSVEILKNLKVQYEKPLPVEKKEGIGVGVIEAPRGTLYYKLTVDAKGRVKEGDIVVPTNQNQIGIEKSIYQYLQDNLDKEKNSLTFEIEKIIRAYDPCMSCASHFLKVKWLYTECT